MTLKYDKNTKLIGGFSIDIVDETDPVWSYMLRHNMLDENIDWVTEDVITDLLEKPKVKLPKFVAEYLEKCKEEGLRLWLAIDIEDCQGDIFPYLLTNMETFARAWLDGYEVEKEKRYKVILKSTRQTLTKLVYEYIHFETFKFNDAPKENIAFTKQELIEAGFGGVFDNPMFEVEEVDE